MSSKNYPVMLKMQLFMVAHLVFCLFFVVFIQHNEYKPYSFNSFQFSFRYMHTSRPFNIVLVEPEIPPNTGSIARLCGATNSVLHLVHPLGFSTDDKHLKRAGLDYWQHVEIQHWENFDTFLAAQNELDLFFFTTKVTVSVQFCAVYSRGVL